MSSKHLNIKFFIEKEEDGRLPFLDINIFGEYDKFSTNVYRKKTFSGVYTNFKSFIPETYKIGLIKSLLFRCFSFCSDFIKFHHEIDKLKSMLYKNSYPRGLVEKCIKELLDKILAPKPVVSAVPKRNLVIAVPYLGKLPLQIRTRINCIMKNKLPYCNIRFVFQTKWKISNFFTFKDETPPFLHSGIAFASFNVVAAVLPIMAKLSVILKWEYVNTWEFLHSLWKELKVMIIPPLKSIFYSAITHLILKIPQFLQPTIMTLMSR